jgi:hypothetical protein
MLRRLLRLFLNLTVAGLFLLASYQTSLYALDVAMGYVHDAFIQDLLNQYRPIIGALGVVLSLGMIGVLVLLHDIGNWLVSWVWRE